MKAWVTIGLPACGKSTWAAAVAAAKRACILERDAVRDLVSRSMLAREFSWDSWDTALEPVVTRAWRTLADEIVRSRKPVIVSDTNLNAAFREQVVIRFRDAGYAVSYVLFDVPREECERRNAERGSKAVAAEAYERLTPAFEAARRSWKEDAAALRIGALTPDQV